VHELEQIAADATEDSVVSIILDGENAWEYYPENGYYFLDALYRKLSAHSTLELTTFSRVLQRADLQRVALPQLVPGSWVYGTFSTWIGDRDKNRGWDLLCAAKRTYDRVLASGVLTELQREQATLQLAACEGSDWFWWFGDYNPAAAVSDFERLFRCHLGNLYRILGEPLPDELSHSVSRGGGNPERGGVMLHGQAPESGR
jgi:alpha-amylase/alpha-mannosidase (GH57 family)